MAKGRRVLIPLTAPSHTEFNSKSPIQKNAVLLGCNQTSELSFSWHRAFTNAISVTRVSPTHQSAPSHFFAGLITTIHLPEESKAKPQVKLEQSFTRKGKKREEKNNPDQKQRVNFIKAKPQFMKNLPLGQ